MNSRFALVTLCCVTALTAAVTPALAQSAGGAPPGPTGVVSDTTTPSTNQPQDPTDAEAPPSAPPPTEDSASNDTAPEPATPGNDAVETPTEAAPVTVAPTGESPSPAQETSEAASGEAPSPSGSAAPRTNEGPIDLCALKEQARRAVLFDLPELSPASITEVEKNDKGQVIGRPSILTPADVYGHARETFFAWFPMKRFHTVVSQVHSPAAMTGQQLSAAQLRTALGTDPFAMRSAECATFVFLPRIVNVNAAWTKEMKQRIQIVNGKKQVRQLPAWSLETTFTLEVGVYKRAGSGYQLHQVVRTDNSGVQALATEWSARDPELGTDYFTQVSPRAVCAGAIPSSNASLTGCQGEDPLLAFQGAPGVPSAKVAGCPAPEPWVERGEQAMREVARCELRRGAQSATMFLQRDVERLPDIRVEGEVTMVEGQVAISLAPGETAAPGTIFVTNDSNFGRIKTPTADGSAMTLDVATGPLAPGEKIHEHAMLGYDVSVQPAILYLLSTGDLNTGLAPGAMLAAGMDLTSKVSYASEIWLRGAIGIFAGADSETFVPIEIGAEAVWYTGGISWTLGAGLSAMSASIDLVNNPLVDSSINATNYGFYGTGGAKYAFSPEWSSSLVTQARLGLGDAEYDELPGLSAGTLTGARATLVLAKAF